MNTTQGNDPAFSRSGFALTSEDYDPGNEGMTKREYFAALTMQGILANSADYSGFNYERMAAHAVEAADALMKALNKEQ